MKLNMKSVDLSALIFGLVDLTVSGVPPRTPVGKASPASAVQTHSVHIFGSPNISSAAWLRKGVGTRKRTKTATQVVGLHCFRAIQNPIGRPKK